MDAIRPVRAFKTTANRVITLQANAPVKTDTRKLIAAKVRIAIIIKSISFIISVVLVYCFSMARQTEKKVTSFYNLNHFLLIP